MTFYFFDLETSSFNARTGRIMQFAGQRADKDLKPIGAMENILIKLTPDVLPDPGAVLVHGITPQKTLAEGITEAEFCKHLTAKISTPDTIMMGYNNIRFDNEFIRFTLWRNFHDAYEWSWKDGRGTWDLLDVARMTRALRPEGIEWPFAADGKPTNSLEYISAVNHLEHIEAHDATSDVTALIALARLLKRKQPGLFDYLLNIRDKKKVAPFVTKAEPLIYTSGRYPGDFNKTTIAVMAAEKPDRSGALMYDLRIDPEEFKGLPPQELAKHWAARGQDAPYFPVKLLSYNKCPAIAPLEVLEKDGGYAKLNLRKELVFKHFDKLQKSKGFGDKLLEALAIMWPSGGRRSQTSLVPDPLQADGSLYDGFVLDHDRDKMSVVRASKPDDLAVLNLDFSDERLKLLLPLYKARNYPDSLNSDEKTEWDGFRHQRLLGGGKSSVAARFYSQLDELSKTPGLTADKKYALEDLKNYALSVIPAV